MQVLLQYLLRADILDHPTLRSRRALTDNNTDRVACTLLVPVNIRATTRWYGEVRRIQITLCHAIHCRQLCNPSKISPTISSAPVVFSMGTPPSHIPRMWKTAPPEIIRRTLAIIQSESTTQGTIEACVFTDRPQKILRPTIQLFNLIGLGLWLRVGILGSADPNRRRAKKQTVIGGGCRGWNRRRTDLSAVCRLAKFEPIFIGILSRCCIPRQNCQKCRIIINEKIIIPFSKNAGHLSHFAGHLMKMRDCPAECGTVDMYVIFPGRVRGYPGLMK